MNNIRLIFGNAFGMTEALVMVSITGVLALLLLPMVSKVFESAKAAKCASNLRQIGIAFHAMAQERDGRLYSREEIGNSSYRAADDPLGLPDIFFRHGYLPDKRVWLSPGGRPSLSQYGNNYAWSRSSNITEGTLARNSSWHTTAIVWNNHTMTLPSVHNVPEPSTGGPRSAPASYRYFSWDNHTKIHFLYLDGHVEKR